MNEITTQDIQKAIIRLPNRPPAMLVHQCAEFYEVSPKQINQAVSRNQDRFPEDFCFKVTEEEAKSLRSQNVTVRIAPGGHYPWMFTRHGIVLNLIDVSDNINFALEA